MLGNGDYPKQVIGDGSQASPSLALFSENSTGFYLDNPGSSSAFTVVKRGNKRIRVEDSATEIVGPLIADDLGATSFSAENGSVVEPSFSFIDSKNTGIFNDDIGFGNRIGFAVDGDKRAYIDDTKFFSYGDIEGTDIYGSNIFANKFVASSEYGFANDFLTTVSNYNNSGDEYLSFTVNNRLIGSFIDGLTPRLDCGTNQMRCGQVSCNSMTTGSINSQSISTGTNSITCGQISSGSISCGTNSMTCGTLVSSGIGNVGTISTDRLQSGSSGITSTGSISCGTHAMTCGNINVNGTSILGGNVTTGTYAMTCGSLSSGSINSGTNGLTCGQITSSGQFSNGSNNVICGTVTCSGAVVSNNLQPSSTSALRLINNGFISGYNSASVLEIAFYPRDSSDRTVLRMGTGGYQINTNGNSNLFTYTGSGEMQIAQPSGGISQKATAVSGGTANGSLNTGVTLTAGTATINNSYVTANCLGFACVTTPGGTPGAYRVQCGAGTYTVTSTSATDTSTLSIYFIKGF